MTAVFKRDLKSYFSSMIGCLYIAFIISLVGIYFSFYNMKGGYPYFGDVLNSISYIVFLALPILTMRSFSDEIRTKTDQILYTSRVSIGKIVMGKYLSMVTVFAIPILVLCLCPLVISKFGNHDFKGDYACILAVFLIGCAYIAMGMFISSLTESPIIAAVITFAILLVLQMMSGITSFIPASEFGSFIGCILIVIVAALIYFSLAKNGVAAAVLCVVGIAVLVILYFVKGSVYSNLLPSILNKIPLTVSLNNFSLKTFDVTAIIYYISIGCLFVFLTSQSIQKRRYS
ncbi:MAG: ABC transporter permease [Lachnospiraceae bacterium]|nr:ABC transporter permease [Lachnospiraceae bacterium]MDE6233094.1 ABC transporter permease [Lachnospiraceae bacterium]MDE6253473.1 ABC transporter permease [Lachnospiraceae bacterium]